MGKYFDPQIPCAKRERVLGLSKKPLGGSLIIQKLPRKLE
jgi:hypothetical protein